MPSLPEVAGCVRSSSSGLVRSGPVLPVSAARGIPCEASRIPALDAARIMGGLARAGILCSSLRRCAFSAPNYFFLPLLSPGLSPGTLRRAANPVPSPGAVLCVFCFLPRQMEPKTAPEPPGLLFLGLTPEPQAQREIPYKSFWGVWGAFFPKKPPNASPASPVRRGFRSKKCFRRPFGLPRRSVRRGGRRSC